MAYELTPMQRARLNELSVEYFKRVELVSVDVRRKDDGPDYVVMKILGDDNGSVAIWKYEEKAKHFHIIKTMQTEHRLQYAGKKLYEYITLFALQIIFAQRQGISDARERSSVKKQKKKAARLTQEPLLPMFWNAHGKMRNGQNV